MSLKHFCWAVEARGLSPASKLVLLLVADGVNQDGVFFGPFDDLAARANMTLEGIDEAIAELGRASLATWAMTEEPATGERCRSILLIEGA